MLELQLSPVSPELDEAEGGARGASTVLWLPYPNSAPNTILGEPNYTMGGVIV